MKYRQNPIVAVRGYDQFAFEGWEAICSEWQNALNRLPSEKKVLTVELYPGTNRNEILSALTSRLCPVQSFLADDAALPSAQVEQMIQRNLTDDRVLGVMDHGRMIDFFDAQKLRNIQDRIDEIKSGLVVVCGTGASLITCGDILVYADLTRWEIQLRWRRKETGNWMADNIGEDQLRKYKRGFFFEWRVADRQKRELMPRMDYLLDTHVADLPKMVFGSAFREALVQVSRQPFSMVPYFDPGVWGGQWMKETLGLEPSATNYAWSFNGVPEENSLCLQFGDVLVQVPAVDLVFVQPKALLGNNVYARFGAEFPIRFDFLDTMQGGNLSLQVHPLTDYIQDRFGMHYTQDESYYILDCEEDATVYLGVKPDVNPREMIAALNQAQEGEEAFDDAKYINQFAVKKHDHVLIPAGTIHCSGSGAMVLEISATPYIFTFKLWDWGRVGLDGKPRPVHIEHGSRVIQWDRDTQWVERELLHRVEITGQGEGWWEERTGLHESGFIESRRLWFSKDVPQRTDGGVQMLMVVEGEGCVISHPGNAFPPFFALYAECFIIPASVGEYIVSPLRQGQVTGLIRAYVRA